MTNEEINIAISEACGSDLEKYRTYEGDINVSALKKYCNDLNAMHEAENILTREQIEVYCEHLNPKYHGIWFGIHATARQRAEAFLRTIGKWEGAK